MQLARGVHRRPGAVPQVAVALGALDAVLPLVLAWKVVTEALYPWTGAPLWEFVERAGSYVAPLALWTFVRRRRPAVVREPPAASVGPEPLPLLSPRDWERLR